MWKDITIKRAIIYTLLISTLLFVTSVANAYTLFDNGEENTLDYTDDSVYVYDFFLPGEPPVQTPTTLNVITGARVSWFLKVFNYSQINMFDGTVANLRGEDNGQINVSGGEIAELLMYKSSQLSFSDDGTIVSGGIWTYDDSYAEISGGSISGSLWAGEDSTMDFSGGSLNGGSLIATENSVITIYGSGFNYSYGAISTSSGHLTGTLANGDSIDNDFTKGTNASIILVPEPATLLLLGLGAVMLRRRR